MKPMHRAARSLPALALGLAVIAAAAQDAAQARLERITLHAGMHNIQAEVARSAAQTQTGLMFRKEMAAHEGMLFVFDQPALRCFWMKNTLLPLSIAFIADDGRIVNIADMQPQSEQSHCAREPVRYALEMNQGWFAKRAIQPGFKLKGAPFAP
jgi:uncharacterized membrane protein (UPF0127 family)